MAVAEALRDIGDAGGLRQPEGTAPRLDPHQQPIAARHWREHARAPTLYLEGRSHAHDPARWIARSSSWSAELRRLTQRPRANASRRRCAMATVAAGLLRIMADNTVSSAIRARSEE